MAWTQTEIDALKAAIASGVRTVVYADRTVTYQNLQDMLTALALIEAEVAGISTESVGRSTVATHSRD